MSIAEFTNIIDIKSKESNNSILKRCLDIILVLIFLILFSPFIIPLIIIIWAFNRELLYMQDRIGINGKIFKCYKFKTLKEHVLNDKFLPVKPHDTRVTKLGKILRKFNLDELPQLLNVLKGDMSIVGPRPHAIKFHNRYKEFYPNINLRLKVKPGITGLAQIKGFRGDVLDEEENKKRIINRIDADIKYINNWSNLYDIKIIFNTFLQVLKIKNLGI